MIRQVSRMSDFSRTAILTIILTIYGLFYTDSPYCLLAAAGLLLMILTIESLSEKNSVGLLTVKLLLITLGCILSEGFLTFLLFAQVGYRKTNFILPPMMFFLYQILCNSNHIPDILPITIVQLVVLICLSAIIWYIQKFVTKYIDYKRRMAVSMGELAINELEERKLNRELLIKNNIIERNTRLEERENISRNIHNSVGHTITAAIMALDAAELLWNVDSDRAIDKVRTANERIHVSLDSIRRAVRVLDEQTENISIDDFKMELEAIMDNFTMDTDIKVFFDFEVLNPELMIPHEHTEFLTGAVEELLTNGIKHGRADRFTIRIQADSMHLKLTVLDNGNSDFDNQNAILRIQNGFGIS